ncbi:MAG: hypothetical protein Q7K57_58780 [Burkholderiaceae bacterium]|nr:hypothetical protein [Burkholderiaceae bacterium]
MAPQYQSCSACAWCQARVSALGSHSAWPQAGARQKVQQHLVLAQHAPRRRQAVLLMSAGSSARLRAIWRASLNSAAGVPASS